MKLTAEALTTVNRAAAAINALKPTKNSGPMSEERKALLLSLIGEIQDARLRGISWRKITAAIAESTGAKFSQTSLKKFVEEHAKETQEVQPETKTVKRYGIDYIL